MKRYFLFYFLTFSQLFSQKPTLFPDAIWLQDVHYAGTIYGGIPAGVMTNVQAHLNGIEYMFHLKSDVAKAKPLIDYVHAQGKKYWVNLDGTVIEGNEKAIVDDGQGITDTLFGAIITLQGNRRTLGKSLIRSINRWEWRNFLISCIKRAIEAGADGSQHDGAGLISYESFDDEDVEAFKNYVITKSISTGDWSYSTSTFKQYLLSKGKTDDDVLNTDNDTQNLKNLINYWKEFKEYRTKLSWQALKDSCNNYATSKNKKYTIALNAAGAFGEPEGVVYTVNDYAIGEFFGWGNLFPYTGTLTVKNKIFEAIGKRFVNWSGPTLEDIPLANPYDRYPEAIEKESWMHLAAQLYASGGLSQLTFPAYNTYPVYNFAQKNREILNSVSSAGEIGVVMSQSQTLKDSRGLYGLLLVLQDINRSFKTIWFKSNKQGINDDLTLSDLTKYKVIFLPEVFYLTNNQRTLLLSYINTGGIVVAVRGNVEYSGNYDENENTQINATWSSLANVNATSIKIYGSGKFISIAHNINESNGYPPPSYGLAYTNFKRSTNSSDATVANKIRDTVSKWIDYALPLKDVVSSNLPLTIRVFRYQDTLTNNFVYHFLNDSVVTPSREAINVGPLTFELAVTHSAYSKTLAMTFYTIDNPDGVKLGNNFAVNQTTGRIGPFTLPAFKRWGFVQITESNSANPPKIEIAKLKINDNYSFKRLKSGSSANITWDVVTGIQNKYEIEVWTNIERNGTPIINFKDVLEESIKNKKPFNNFSNAKRVFHILNSSSSNSHFINANLLNDSTVYLVRIRAFTSTNDTSNWTENFMYRNAPPRSPILPSIYTQHQALWYYSWNGALYAPADTAARLIYSIQKGGDHRGQYGGDWELDTILYFINLYTDSTTSKKGDTTKAKYKIGSEIVAKLGPFKSKTNLDDLQDTLSFYLTQYENFGIYFRPIASDLIDSSKEGQWFGYYLDSKNDPPNPFTLVEPTNNIYTTNPQPFTFKWINKSDPDPFNKVGYNISKIEIYFDSVSTFNSVGLKKYSKNREGLNFEKDTIGIQLPPNFFQVENLLQYKKIYWKIKMYDFDRDIAEGGGNGVLSTESSNYYLINIGTGVTFTITASATSGGTITPNGNVSVNSGSNQTFAFTPNIGFKIDSVIVDGTNAGNVTSYTFTNVTVAHLIKVYFSVLKFTISVTAGSNGTISPSGNLNVNYGDSARFIFTPNSGHKIDSVIVNNVSVGQVSFYTFKNITTNQSLKVVFAKTTWVGGLTNMPTDFILMQNYPNPFNPTTEITFGLPNNSKIRLEVFNLLGQNVETLIDGEKSAGYHSVKFTSKIESGIFVYRLSSTDKQNKQISITKKMILMK